MMYMLPNEKYYCVCARMDGLAADVAERLADGLLALARVGAGRAW